MLTRNGIVEGQQGKGGGYRLTRVPEEYGIGEILRLTEGDLSPVSCMACGAEPCRQRCRCKTYPLWAGLQETIDNYLDNITLAALVSGEL